MQLRWKDVQYTADADRGPTVPTASYWPECGPDHLQLQQWWFDKETGNGEWRPVLMDYAIDESHGDNDAAK